MALEPAELAGGPIFIDGCHMNVIFRRDLAPHGAARAPAFEDDITNQGRRTA
jgi:hypothetical protein